MIKELINIFKKDSLLDQAYERTYEMIDITFNMYKEIQNRLRDDAKYKFSFDIRDQDTAINKYEREVRRNVFNHLCVAGMEDLNSGLILVSIIIDIERVGDYTKNMVELAESLDKILKGGKFEKDLHKVEEAVEDTFKRVREILEEGDDKKAEDLLFEYNWVNKVCDKHVSDLLNKKENKMSSAKAVALSLYFRYLKRINSHLRNVATSVVNPFPRIGFKVKKQKK
ncbi:Na+/phosphate symporter [Candidatus Methanophagaceae archaeon]|nr:Na+/phosphate symporter [Methanophagales archaeon]